MDDRVRRREPASDEPVHRLIAAVTSRPLSTATIVDVGPHQETGTGDADSVASFLQWPRRRRRGKSTSGLLSRRRPPQRVLDLASHRCPLTKASIRMPHMQLCRRSSRAARGDGRRVGGEKRSSARNSGGPTRVSIEAQTAGILLLPAFAAQLIRTARKRNSSDRHSIFSEDAGKLPDDNVPEALARVPGIIIVRKQRERNAVVP